MTRRSDEGRIERRTRRRRRVVTKEQWWPCEWTEPGGFAPEITLTRFHPVVRRAMRDARGVVIEFHTRLGWANMELGKVDDIELRCVLLDLAARWMRSQDDGERE